jgi:2-dehydro-3-deoxygluconokinase
MVFDQAVGLSNITEKEATSMGRKAVCFGEIMMRLSPPGFQRFGQARSFEVIYGGGEANVAVSLANFGTSVSYVTRLPQNDLGDACIMFLRQYGVDTSHIARGGDRIGIYFMENGAMQRASKVVYDRANSSIATIKPGKIDWGKVFDGASWFHWTGITPAIAQGSAEVCLEAAKKAKEMGLTVSCDLNYRAKLWKWGKTATEVMEGLVTYADLAIGNEEDAEKVFGITAPDTDWRSGEVDGEKYRTVAEALVSRFPNLRQVAITLRGSLSASHNTWSGLFYDGKQLYLAPVFQLTHIVDRVGGGDAFAAGLIHGLMNFEGDRQRALNFAVAASCLKHSIFGDFNLVTVAEAEKIMGGDVSGRVSR